MVGVVDQHGGAARTAPVTEGGSGFSVTGVSRERTPDCFGSGADQSEVAHGVDGLSVEQRHPRRVATEVDPRRGGGRRVAHHVWTATPTRRSGPPLMRMTSIVHQTSYAHKTTTSSTCRSKTSRV